MELLPDKQVDGSMEGQVITSDEWKDSEKKAYENMRGMPLNEYFIRQQQSGINPYAQQNSQTSFCGGLSEIIGIAAASLFGN